ncbi:restriction endonuclease subunit S [Thermococcus paralvinellae]|uniref:Type I restriction-modification enzyme, S subunit n=1 Tax=Thermococcus paralvinellae TaxID=582419 RepID=W0I983_9EURY|nr:restriction endonuclease subunit S [Thermococcus paralvinellae]AHF80963.1 type I restriction-modification enzyme, S subunit [Thermococcus paralvinellae]
MSEALPAFQFYRETRLKEVELNGRKVRIPEEWEVVELGEIAKFQRGYSYRRADLSETRTSKRFITINDLEKEGGVKRTAERIYLKESVQVKERFILSPGDILIANTDMTKGFIIGAPLIITSDLIPEDGIAVFSMDLTKLIFDKENINSHFLFYWLSWGTVRTIMKAFSQGLNVQHLNHDLVKTVKVVLPPLEEQKKIAGVLRSIDEAIQAIEESIAKLERLKKGTMETLLTRGINHTRFKTVELNGRKVEIPEEWEVVELGEVAERIKKSIDPQKLPNELFELYSIPAFHETGKPEIVKGSSIKSTKFVIDVGVVLFGKLNPRIPKIWLVTGESDYKKISSTEFIPLKPVRNLKSEFLYYALQDKYFIQISQQVVTGSTPSRQRINPNKFMKLKIPLPPIEEQKKIAEILRTIDGAIEAKREKREKLERMKRAVMEKLLTGEVRVR